MDLMSSLTKSPNDVSHIVMVNFYFNLLHLSSQNGDFLNFTIANDLFQLVNIPMKITSQYATIIDNVFVCSIDLNKSFTDLIWFPGSDPLPAKICCSLK